MKRTILNALVVFSASLSFILAQGTVSGTVTDADGKPLAGANVIVEGTNFGAAAALNGSYTVDVPGGSYTLTASVVGYTTESRSVSVGQSNKTVNFELSPSAVALGGVEVLANRVNENSAVPYTDFLKSEIDFRLGGRGLPQALSTQPNVHVNQGGGWDDENVFVRGFDDRYTSYAINGVPMNDMENGNLYFSNWGVLADVSSVVQIQKGASAINLAVPNLGGVVNFISFNADQDASTLVKHENGSNGLNRTAVVWNSGMLMDGKLALVAAGSRRTAHQRVAKGTFSEAWGYYFMGSYQFNSDNRIEFVALGAPQKHGQAYYTDSISKYSNAMAKKFGVAEEDMRDELGWDYNANGYGTFTSPYTEPRAWASWSPFDGVINRNMKISDTSWSTSEWTARVNYFHKPIVQMNSYNTLANGMTLASSLYYSGGEGGGGGLTGSDGKYTIIGNIRDGKSNDPFWSNRKFKDSNILDVQGLYDYNLNPETRQEVAGIGVVTPVAGRSSRNNQITIGLMSKLSMDLGDQSKLTLGVDLRSATIEHTSRIVDLFGADAFYNDYRGDEAWSDTDRYRSLGDRQEYWTENTVDWQGVYAQYDWSNDRSTVFAVGGLTSAEYSSMNKFGGALGEDDPVLEADGEMGYQVKFGMSHNLDETYQLYGNVGYTQLTPSLDKLINDEAFQMNKDFKNEFASFVDFGTRFKSANGQVVGSVGLYYTLWENRDLRIQQTDASGDRSYLSVNGQDQAHGGLEYSISYQPLPVLRFDLRGSENKWQNVSDVAFNYIKDLRNPTNVTNVRAYMDGTRIGGAPQSQTSLLITTFVNRMKASLEYETFDNMYSQYRFGDDGTDALLGSSSPFTNPNNLYKHIQQKAPRQDLVNLLFEYRLDNIKLNLAVFNALDEEIMLDIEDYGMKGNPRDLSGQPQMMRNYTLGVSYSF